ncbi:zinc-binding alcohol dehydrogenase family protein [Marinococcus halophilus]|uniref:zinc-binding alcohol dehydrogenase family protein n=1 Tax=Marinococcus halophilus TaxID=1371 RepID=UPI0009A6FD19|nr:zinc-binding alcohol dehydrogenase family protein [Marinococcus halophilus]OZT80516.1 zinc-binding alcohol dehydrogenase family protein [Marinococcus halophilus]
MRNKSGSNQVKKEGIIVKAIGFKKHLPIEEDASFEMFDIAKPEPKGRDLLVRVQAVSVNPVDTKIRGANEGTEEEQPQILGFDAAGIIEAAGEEASLFQSGDEVYYAGSNQRSGSNQEYHLVDERVVGRRPKQLSMAESAAMPLTAITAYEAMFDRIGIVPERDRGSSVLVLNGAGGVGSIAIQLAKWAGLDVVATASREETTAWCEQMGADKVINHHQPLLKQLQDAGYDGVDYILCFTDTAQHWDSMAECIRPQGAICSIVETEKPLQLTDLQAKSVAFMWEFMFTRPMYQTEDMIRQHVILGELADLFDQGTIKPTLTETLTPLNANQMKEAHRKVESGKAIGKIVLEDWE